MEKKLNLIEKTFLFAWPYVIVVSLVILLISQNMDLMLSFILGSACSLLMNSLNYRVLKSAFQYQPHTIQKKTILMYLLRFAFYAVVLYTTSIKDSWNLYATAAGMLTFRIVLIPLTLYFAKKEGGIND